MERRPSGPASPRHLGPGCWPPVSRPGRARRRHRHSPGRVPRGGEQAAATARLTGAAAELGKAAEALHGLIELAEMTGRSGRTGKTDLN